MKRLILSSLILLFTIIAPAIGSASASAKEKVVLFFFHGDIRCSTCLAFEKFSRKSMVSFAEELKSGRLEWREVNFDRPENKHFIKDFNLFDKGIVLVKEDGNKIVRWKNIEKVWDFWDNEAGFVAMMNAQLENFLGR